MKEYGLPNIALTNIIEWRTCYELGVDKPPNKPKWFSLGKDKGKISNPQPEHFIKMGWVLKVVPVRVKYERKGAMVIDIDTVTWLVEPWTPMEIWLSKIADSDTIMPRQIEDIWDAIGIDKAPDIVREKHAAKKELRAGKPE